MQEYCYESNIPEENQTTVVLLAEAVRDFSNDTIIHRRNHVTFDSLSRAGLG